MSEQTPVVDEIHTKEFSLFNVYLVSVGQVQRLDTHGATNEQMKNGPQSDRETRNKLHNHKNKYKKFLSEETAVLDEIVTKEFSLFNVFLVSAGQVQRLDTRGPTNDKVQNQPQFN